MPDRETNLLKIAERLEVLASKWVEPAHHDWPEVKMLAVQLAEYRNNLKGHLGNVNPFKDIDMGGRP